MRYEKYKDSGFDWIGEIPEHWEVKKVKYLSKNFDGKRIPLNAGQRAKISGNFPYYGANGVVDYVDDFLFDGEYVLIGEDGAPFFIKHRNVAFLVNGKFWVNNHAHILKINPQINPKIITHLFNCVDYKEYISGSTRDKLTQEQLSSIKLLQVPKKEQTAIANYLDRKTAEIDELINQKEQLLKLYEEEKTAIINQAVTKGLTADGKGLNDYADNNKSINEIPKSNKSTVQTVKLKDSGIDWLGEIPEHWEVKKLKYVGYFQRGFDLPTTSFRKGEIPVYGSNGIIGFHNIASTKAPSITIGRSGSVGEVNFISTNYWAHNTALFLLNNFGNNVSYLYYLLKSLDLKSYSSGTAVGTLNRNNIHLIKIGIPQKEEQTAIVQYIEYEINRINTKAEKTKKLIDLLGEYKQSLISEVVTGKIKVA